MHFLSVLIIVAIYRSWPAGNWLRENYAAETWFQWVSARVVAPLSRYVACVGAPVVIVLLLSLSLDGFFAGMVYLILSVATLLYCLDLIDLDVLFDDQGIRMRSVNSDTTLEALQVEQQDFLSSSTYTLFQGVMVVLFWFILAGPAGALLYRLTQDYQDSLDSDEEELVYLDQLLFWLEWVPVRMTTIIFALLGNFHRSLDLVVDSFTNLRDDAMPILAQMASASLDLDERTNRDEFLMRVSEDLGDMHALLQRSLWGWVGFAALLAIFGF